MSIFTKITVLFLISLILMIGIGYKIDTINAQRYESLVQQKYLLDGRKIFRWLATSSSHELHDKFKTLNLISIDKPSVKRLVMNQPHTLGRFEIIETTKHDYVMHIRYIDEDLYLYDTTLQENQQERWALNGLVILDILVLLAIFIILLRMLTPLRSIAFSMRLFMAGKYQHRSSIQSNDEIGEVAHTYNDMADTIEKLIRSREDLLRNVAHELRTPIARGLFVIENLDDPKAHKILKASFTALDQLTSELLALEKLESTGELEIQTFSAETLVLEALSKLCLIDESSIHIVITSNFSITGDLSYLSIALKNLLDNALKYSDKFPVSIEVFDQSIRVINHGKPLEKGFTHLLTPFTRQESSQQGFGLGLDIVTKILNKHGFSLAYDYHDEHHSFSIYLKSN